MDEKKENLLDLEITFKLEHCNELSPNHMLTPHVKTIDWGIKRLGDEIYEHLEEGNLFHNEQKGCHRSSRVTKDQSMIGKMVLRNCKRRMKNLFVAWIDCKKAYNMVPHSWIMQCLAFFQIAHNAKAFLEKTVKLWRVELTSDREVSRCECERRIFQGDTLSPILLS